MPRKGFWPKQEWHPIVCGTVQTEHQRGLGAGIYAPNIQDSQKDISYSGEGVMAFGGRNVSHYVAASQSEMWNVSTSVMPIISPTVFIVLEKINILSWFCFQNKLACCIN